eukprot:3778097-Heterocapsa_arctica.AAC.1
MCIPDEDSEGEGCQPVAWDPGGDAVATVVEVPAEVPGSARGRGAPAPDFTYIHTYIHTCIHTYIHTFGLRSSGVRGG